MLCTLPAIVASPLPPVSEVVRGIPMEFVAAALGALLGVALFGLGLLFFWSWRGGSRRTAPTGGDIVVVAPYPVAPGFTSPAIVEPPSPLVTPRESAARALGFVPSSALSARAFAKMGYVFDEPRFDVTAALPGGVGMRAEPQHAAASPVETGPMSEVTMASSERILASASIAELDLDDGPTELCAPWFDAPPLHPRRPGARPKIRLIPPSPPRQSPDSSGTRSPSAGSAVAVPTQPNSAETRPCSFAPLTHRASGETL